MPIYEYSCLKCDESFEVMHFSSKGEKVLCPRCGSAKIKKEFSSFAAQSDPSGDIGACSGDSCGMGNSGPTCPGSGCCGMSSIS